MRTEQPIKNKEALQGLKFIGQEFTSAHSLVHPLCY
jgi:hypothetical protein